MSSTLTFDALVSMIKEVQPSLSDLTITPDLSVVDDLGIDSLDLLQLSRHLNRDYDLDLDLDAWAEGSDEHHQSVGSILNFLAAGSAV